MADRNEEAEDELKEAFVKTADKAQVINAKQLVSVLRYMGQNPSDAEAQDMITKFGSGGTMTQQAFVTMMSAKNKDDGSEESVIEAFQVFDKDGKGYISAADLRNILTNLGDKLNENQVNQMLSEALASDDGNLDYRQFVQMMINR
eukprot:TRINITY_DN1804_c0_g1_i1.p1 TRINITY_DN1804_c0_g1~~TRINITY_DN1804_c0_g1_i1.p1  ORF type:complete len:154 (+),score=59.15 TRINITY_DN1804_c0_g1_i1:27-464(+)